MLGRGVETLMSQPVDAEGLLPVERGPVEPLATLPVPAVPAVLAAPVPTVPPVAAAVPEAPRLATLPHTVQ